MLQLWDSNLYVKLLIFDVFLCNLWLFFTISTINATNTPKSHFCVTIKTFNIQCLSFALTFPDSNITYFQDPQRTSFTY